MRNWEETLAWYKTHQTTREIGFDPDGMCLKVCRTARAISAVYPTAKVSQDATPKKYRVHSVRDLRKGMVLYFDDPNDSNSAGHIVTMIGRVRGADPGQLRDVLTRTNSVESGKLTVVRATYFVEHWNDSFQFGANWLNGEELDIPKPKTVEEPLPSRMENFWAGRPDWDTKILDRAVAAGRHDLKDKVAALHKAAQEVPDRENKLVQRFNKAYSENGVIKIHLLTEAVNNDSRFVKIKATRDKLRSIIKTLPQK